MKAFETMQNAHPRATIKKDLAPPPPESAREFMESIRRPAPAPAPVPNPTETGEQTWTQDSPAQADLSTLDQINRQWISYFFGRGPRPDANKP